MSSYSSNTDAVYCSRASSNNLNMLGINNCYMPALRPTRVTAVRLRMSNDVPAAGGVLSLKVYPEWSGGGGVIVTLGTLAIQDDWKAGDVVIVNLTDDERATLYPGNRIMAFVDTVVPGDTAVAAKVTFDFYELEDGPPITVTPDGTKPVPNYPTATIRSGGQYFTPATGMTTPSGGFGILEDGEIPAQIEEEDFFLNYPPKEEPAPATRSTKKTKTKKVKADDGC